MFVAERLGRLWSDAATQYWQSEAAYPRAVAWTLHP
jgi:hypothetical protein